jgi:hypothetical protein|tara:strand:- start:1288 stop:1464 length:177 start_codon:yes stop_codon:yes gene_type:complete
MIGEWIKTTTGIAISFLICIVLLVLFFDKSAFTQEEIDWCEANRPNAPMDICANEFGY